MNLKGNQPIQNTSGVYVARAPVRVDAAGGGSDCEPYILNYDGAVVNLAITSYAYAHLQVHQEDRRIYIISDDFDQAVQVDHLDHLKIDGTLDLLKGSVLRLAPDFGFTLRVRCDVKPGTGLGSSGAVGVACVAAIDRAMGVTRSQLETAILANDIERKDLGKTGGNQDALGAGLGGINHIVYHQGNDFEARRLKIPEDTIAELERRCVLIYTGEVHLSENIHEDIKASYALPDSPTVAAMKNLACVANNIAVALGKGDLEAVGQLFLENWRHHQLLHASCTNDVLSRYYDALAAHTLGGKTCGAGGGGTILVLAIEGHSKDIINVCRQMSGEIIPFRLDRYGVRSWTLSV